MKSATRTEISRALQELAASQAATMQLLEHALALFTNELALEPIEFWQKHASQFGSRHLEQPTIEFGRLSVSFNGRSCFLGNSLAFRLFARLARTPDVYVSYEALLSEVWGGVRSDSAVRSIVKTLRCRLREAGMSELATAIGGSEPGYYALRLEPSLR
jgi:DNA-binding response OmpR family regulator